MEDLFVGFDHWNLWHTCEWMKYCRRETTSVTRIGLTVVEVCLLQHITEYEYKYEYEYADRGHTGHQVRKARENDWTMVQFALHFGATVSKNLKPTSSRC